MLKSHPEVVNNHPSTLIIGFGWVGQYIGKYFKDSGVSDLELEKKGLTDSLGDGKWKLGFICVPTPMRGDGSCDTSIVEDVIQDWKGRVEYFCLKSTVPVGTTERLAEKYGVKICFSPEYLGETVGHPMNEANPETFVILGGDKETTSIFAEAWTLVTNSYSRILQTDYRTAELTKLMANAFVATKISFVNEFYDIAQESGVDFNELRELWLQDKRVSRSHTYVYRENRGFGGKCIPKDVSNLATAFNSEFMSFLLDYNERLRYGKDRDRQVGAL